MKEANELFLVGIFMICINIKEYIGLSYKKQNKTERLRINALNAKSIGIL